MAFLLETHQAGRPYLDHLRRVAARVQAITNDPDAVAVAWLHDVVEDTPVSLDRLREVGFKDTVIEGVDDLSRRPGEGDENYHRVAANDLARLVKQADLWDHTHPDRVGLLDPADTERLLRKYAHAARLLEGGVDAGGVASRHGQSWAPFRGPGGPHATRRRRVPDSLRQ